VTAVQRAREDAGDDAAEDLAEHVDPDLVPVAVEDDGWAKGASWADGAARECSGCAEHEALLLPCLPSMTHMHVPASSC
jgi:hypothetical protein